ncbi:MAG TPA: BtpA/SgcQ family protein [Anaerolineaceae bacterium]
MENPAVRLPKVIAALHLPPFPGAAHPDARSLAQIQTYVLRNVETAVQAGVQAVYLQDLGDHPVAPHIPPHVVAGVAAVGAAVRAAFPDLTLGVCLMGHGAREPLAVAQAIGAQFVRLKVYVGAMVKAEGLLQGCAHEAIQYRAQIHAEDIAILADVYDRTGEPLGRMPLVEEARQAATFGRADGLVLTGRSFDETVEMVTEARQAKLGIPILIGGSVNEKNVSQALSLADGVIVSTAFKPIGGWTRESLQADWSAEKVRAFMQAAQNK